MNTLWHSIDATTRSAAPKRAKRPRYALTVSLWLAAGALVYFAARAV